VGGIKRRRECLSCKARINTQETYILNYPMLIKKDGRREPFQKAKLLIGIQAACQKRPISQSEIDSSVERISDKIRNRGEKEVTSELIGRFVMSELKKLDEVAYVRFASVYMTFKEVNEFLENIGNDPVWV